jgi:asparagine synthase (glutamine-hydrolysing)
LASRWVGLGAHLRPRARDAGGAATWLGSWARVASDDGEAALAVATGAPGDGPVVGAGSIGPVSAVIDGYIDNQEELRASLRVEAGTSPGDLIARAYLSFGPNFPDRLRGDFAIVVWDASERRLVACRDPFGIRPLYYLREGTQVFVSSAVEPLLQCVPGRIAPDERMVLEYLLWRYRSADHTFFQSIRAVPSGHVTIIDRSRIEHRRYWFPPGQESAPVARSRQEWHEAVRHLFVRSVARRLTSKRPVVVHVSGGLDSSSIAGASDLLLRAGDQAPAIFGAAGLHPGLTCDETPYIQAVARRVSFPIETWDATQTDSAALEAPAIERPGARSPMIGGTSGDLAIARAHGAATILSGMGGDEIMATAGMIQDAIAAHDYRLALRELFFFEGADLRGRAARLKYLIREATPLPARRPVARYRARLPDWLAPSVREKARDLFEPEAPSVRFASHMAEKKWGRVSSPAMQRPIEAVQRCGREAGVDYRFPFLDRDLVELVMGVPYWAWPPPSLFARLHREAFQDLLPVEVSTRSGKVEFTSAVANGLNKASATVETLLGTGEWASGEYTDRAEVARTWKQMTQSGKVAAREWRDLWAVLTVEAWMRRISGYHPGREDV